MQELSVEPIGWKHTIWRKCNLEIVRTAFVYKDWGWQQSCVIVFMNRAPYQFLTFWRTTRFLLWNFPREDYFPQMYNFQVPSEVYRARKKIMNSCYQVTFSWNKMIAFFWERKIIFCAFYHISLFWFFSRQKSRDIFISITPPQLEIPLCTLKVIEF